MCQIEKVNRANKIGTSSMIMTAERRIETISSFQTFRCNIKTILQQNIGAYTKQIVMVRIEYLEEL